MKPSYINLKTNFSSNRVVLKEALFTEIGWQGLIPNMNYDDTCAIRMSLALIKSGMTIPGRMAIMAGKYKGKLIEPGHNKLCAILKGPAFLGRPEIFKSPAAENAIAGRSGIASFWRIGQGAGGHIDLISTKNYQPVCGSSCYFNSADVWFWPLK
jgi:hypothetical protein